jgi:methylated-DNA-[protein]-cysteine S-methyltransferase
VSRFQVHERIVLFPSELGWMAIHGCGNKVRQLVFGPSSPDAALAQLDRAAIDSATIGLWNGDLIKRLQAFAAGARDDFLDVELDLGPQTEFQRRVIDRCRQIEFGAMLTYGQLAEAAGFARAGRAVGSVMRAIRVPLIVPCHRVVGAGGPMRGRSSCEGVRMKLRLLEREAIDKQRDRAAVATRIRARSGVVAFNSGG